jgi:hypothetical protein
MGVSGRKPENAGPHLIRAGLSSIDKKNAQTTRSSAMMSHRELIAP